MQLFVRFRIPIRYFNTVSAPGLTFFKWLPQQTDDAIVVEKDGLALRLSFDATCVVGQRTDYKNVLAQCVLAETTFVATAELGRFILELDWRDEGEGPLQDAYLRVGQAIYELVSCSLKS
jgi:hypothetical protein